MFGFGFFIFWLGRHLLEDFIERFGDRGLLNSPGCFFQLFLFLFVEWFFFLSRKQLLLTCQTVHAEFVLPLEPGLAFRQKIMSHGVNLGVREVLLIAIQSGFVIVTEAVEV